MAEKIRYEVTVKDKGGNDAMGFLKAITFPVAEAALGFTYIERPKYITAGEIILNSLWVKGSPKLQAKGECHTEAALKCNRILQTFNGTIKDGVITIKREEPDTSKGASRGKPVLKTYKCTLRELDRDTLEDAMSYAIPTIGNPLILTAGRVILLGCWSEGDEAIKNDEELLITACMVAYRLINIKESQLKKV